MEVSNRARNAILHAMRSWPCNKEDPISLETIRPKCQVVFKRVQSSGAVVAYIAPLLARYLLGKKETSEFRDPMTNTPLHPVELRRLDRLLARTGFLMPSVFDHYQDLQKARGGTHNELRNWEVLSLEMLVTEALTSLFTNVTTAWNLGLSMIWGMDKSAHEQLLHSLAMYRDIDEDRASAHLIASTEHVRGACPDNPYVDSLFAWLVCMAESCQQPDALSPSRFDTIEFLGNN
jgi:hypothetical protein